MDLLTDLLTPDLSWLGMGTGICWTACPVAWLIPPWVSENVM